MVDAILFGIAALALVLSVIALLVIWRKRQEGKPVETDYYTLFVMGTIFLPVGLVLMIALDIGYGASLGWGQSTSSWDGCAGTSGRTEGRNRARFIGLSRSMER